MIIQCPNCAHRFGEASPPDVCGKPSLSGYYHCTRPEGHHGKHAVTEPVTNHRISWKDFADVLDVVTL